MDKKIKLEIAVGVVLIIAVMIGGFAWLGKKQQQQIQAAIQPSKSQTALQPAASNPGGDGTILVQSDQAADQYKGGEFSIAGLRMTPPDGWTSKETHERMYIKDNNLNSKYDVSLVLSVSENNPNDIKAFKDERTGTEYTGINGGEIFKMADCGAVACNGAIINGNVYSFNWNLQSNEPFPQNVPSGWQPTSNFTPDAIWNMLKTVAAQ